MLIPRRANPQIPAVCTITTRSHVGLVRCLTDSFFRQHPSGIAYVLYVDDVPPSERLQGPDLRSVDPADLEIPELASMKNRYNVFELCNGLKPFLLRHVLASSSQSKLCYFDSDIFIFDSLDDAIWDPLDSCSILLTPHLCRLPEMDADLVWRDL